MLLLTISFLAAMVAAVVLTHRTRAWAHRIRVLDHPDGLRHRHSRSVPRAGGVGLVLACILGMLVWAALGGPNTTAFLDGADVPLTVIGGALLVFLLGMRDDVRRIRARVKLATQGSIAAAVCLAGAGIPPQALGLTGSGSLAVAIATGLSLLWIVGVTNSVNLLDGSDGVAAGAAAIAAAAFMVAAILLRQPVLAAGMAVLAGACAGFLMFNFPPATIFLGDGGSLFLGFSLAMGGVGLVRAEPTGSVLMAAGLAVAVPVADTILVIYRRIADGRPIFAPDRAHIHHRLLELGHGPGRVALLIYAAALFAAVLALGLVVAEPRTGMILLAVAVLAGWRCVRYLAIPEALRVRDLRGVQFHSRAVHADAPEAADTKRGSARNAS